MPKEDLNQNAKRNVVKTSKYTHLMQKGACKVEATTKGDTLHTVLGMKEFALKHANQTKKLANALLGKNLKQTVGNNYGFMYSHFQYEADPALQQMRSPQCSWSQRFTGIDCKSYSIFASTLLINQGINHFIRRVKQPNFNLKYWSHVYVVIPIDQETLNLNKGYYTIDGTLHSNTETPYLEKHDTEMSGLKHVWLNGPAPAQPQNNSFENALSSFQNFLSILYSQGVSFDTIKEIVRVINVYLSQGIDPFIKVTGKGISVDKSFIPFIKSGLNGDGQIDLNNIDLGQVVDTALDSGFFNNTFGAVFTNGMNLSCWNSTFTPQQTSQQVNQVHIPAMNNLFNAVKNSTTAQQLEQNLNVFEKYTANALQFFTDERLIGNNWEQCSRLALDIYREYYWDQYNKAMPLLIEGLNQIADISFTTTTGKTTIPPVYDKQSGPAGRDYSYRVFKINQIYGSVNDSGIDNIDFNGNNNQNNTGNYTDLPIDNQNQPKLAGFSIWQGLILTGVVLGGIALSKSESKNNKESNKINQK